MKKQCSNKKKEGAALIVALWVLIILALIVGSFAFEVDLEGMLVSYKRKKYRAEMLARSGIEYARAILDQAGNAKQLEVEDMAMEENGDFMMSALHVKNGVTTEQTVEFEEGGSFTVTLEAAEGGLNVNVLEREDWLDIFEMANVPSTEWDMMIDCFEDWIDENDLHGLNGAESDDPFYEEAGYPCKNGPLDSVEELLLIKGWGPEILYGREADADGDGIIGLADKLTVWGDGKLNLNSASVDAMRAAGLNDDEIPLILEDRNGPDGEPNTADDGLSSDYLNGDSRFTLQSSFVKVTSIGDKFGNQYYAEAIFVNKNNEWIPVYWNEGPEKE